LLNAYLGWPWIFWFLIIVTVVFIVPYILAVPETARKVVGNGSIPPQGWNMTLIDWLRFRNKPKNRSVAPAKGHKIPIPNPLNTLKVLRDKEYVLPAF
jgi:MFS family permease